MIIPMLLSGILAQIRRLQPDAVVFLGDTLDKFITINSMRLTEATDFFQQCMLLTKVILLIGNHDIPRKRYMLSTYHGFNALRFWGPQMIVVDRQCVEFEVNGHFFRAVPYCPNGRMQEALDTLPGTTCDKVWSATFCHQEIRGHHLTYLMGNTGDVWPFGRELLIAGHIHHHHHIVAKPPLRQTAPENTGGIDVGNSEVLYVGSPYQDNHSESPDKSISLLTFYRNTENASDVRWKEERIHLGLPTKMKLSMSASEYARWLPNTNTIYTLTISGTTSENNDHAASDKTSGIRNFGGKVTFVRSDILMPMAHGHQLTVQPQTKSSWEMVADVVRVRPHLWDVYIAISQKLPNNQTSTKY